MTTRSFPVSRRLLRVIGACLLMTAPSIGAAQGSRPDTTFTLSRGALVDITVRRGVLVLRGTDRAEASLRSSNGTVTARSTGGGVVLGTRQAMGRSFTRDTDASRVELTVPRNVRVVISAGSADVELRDIDGDVEIRSSNGDVRMDRLGGRAIVETLSGDLVITGGVGDVRVTSSSGDVNVEGVRGSVNVTTTSGDVTVLGTRVPGVRIESISGDAEFDGSVAPDARVHVSTHSGDVALRLGDDARGTLEFETHTGEMQTGIPVTTVGPTSGQAPRNRAAQRYEFGGGGSLSVMISTFSGDVRFERGSSRSSDR